VPTNKTLNAPSITLNNTPSRSLNGALVAALLLLAFGQSAAHAEIFKSIDKHGRVVYTDRPSPSSKNSAVELPSLNTQPPIQTTTATRRPAAEAAPTYTVQIVTPAEQAQIPMGQHQVPVSLQLTPPLSANHSVQLYLDGQPFGAPGHSAQLMLDNLHRGEHTLQAAVLDQQGKELNRSGSVLFYVQRPSALN